MSKYNKYHAQKVEFDGKRFDSRREARRYAELRLLERAGEITGLRTQVPCELIPAQDGERPCRYVADFVYSDLRTGEIVVEDVKGVRTREYVIKRKLMLWRYGVRLTEI